MRRFICLFYLSPLLSQANISSLQNPAQNKDLQLKLGLQTIQYFTQVETTPQSSSAQLAQVDFKYADKQSVVDFGFYNYFESGSSQVNVREAYYSMGTQSFGRQLHQWSAADRFWKTSYFEPQFAHDPLRSEPQGLIGYFHSEQHKNWKHTLLLSPLFVPHVGPDVQEKDGILTSKSRWYKSTPDKFKFNDYDGDIVYELNIPNYIDVAAHPGIVWGSELQVDQHEFRISGAYKPNNKLNLKYQQLLNTPADQDVYATAKVYPRVSYHSVLGADYAYIQDQSRMTFSLVADVPQNFQTEKNYIEQKYVASQMASAVMQVSNYAVFQQNFDFTFGLFKLVGQQIEDRDQDNQLVDSIQGARFDFTEATQVAIQSQKYLGSYLTEFSFKWLYDFAQTGSVTQFETLFYPQKQLALLIGADVLSVRNEDNPKDEMGFMNQYRSNDRVYTGLNYVF